VLSETSSGLRSRCCGWGRKVKAKDFGGSFYDYSSPRSWPLHEPQALRLFKEYGETKISAYNETQHWVAALPRKLTADNFGRTQTPENFGGDNFGRTEPPDEFPLRDLQVKAEDNFGGQEPTLSVDLSVYPPFPFA